METKLKQNSGFEKLPYEYELEEDVEIMNKCPGLRVLVIDLEFNVSAT